MDEGGAEPGFEGAACTEGADAFVPCSRCNGHLGEEYWTWQASPLCESCRRALTDWSTLDQEHLRSVKALTAALAVELERDALAPPAA